MTGLGPGGLGKGAPKNRPREISLARKAAFDVLLAVDRGHSHSDDLLLGKQAEALSLADRNLATALVLGVLRWQIRLDDRLHGLLKHPNTKLDPEVLIALRLGAFQILQMDRIPARAAIDESVELAKRAGHRFASGMINAVLRKLASAPSVAYAEESPAKLAIAEAHPIWMVKRWIDFYGKDAVRSICRHGQIQPAQSARMANSAVQPELVQAGIVVERGQLLAAACTVVSGDVRSTPAFLEGRVRFQDEGSQLVAEIAASSLVHSDGRILDACAAPGGKTLILAERSPKARILACESSPSRLEQLRRRLATNSERIECRLADAAALTEDAAFDLVLADVPCSGTGTLGRNPEIRHRLRIEDLSRQAERQRAILAAALRAVRPGGRVVYSTCSLEPEENEQVVAAAFAASPSVRAGSLKACIESMLGAGILTTAGADLLRGSLTPEGALRLLPGVFQCDGFFIALIERNI